MSLANIKTQIKANLDELVTATTLGEVHADDFSADPLQRNIANYPAAILTTPYVESEPLTNLENKRTAVFEVLIIEKQDNISNINDLETLIEAVLDKFDQDITLNGEAINIEPTTSPAVPSVTKVHGHMIMFALILRVNYCVESSA